MLFLHDKSYLVISVAVFAASEFV